MSRRLALLLCLVALVATALPASNASGADSPSRYIVVLKDSVREPEAVANDHARDHGAQVSHVYRHALKGYAAAMSNQAAARVSQDDRVAYLDPDQPVQALAQSTPTGINRIDGEVSSQASGDGGGSVGAPAVAVLDSGSGPHADLNVAGGKNCSSGRKYSDGNGHGTHVAGTIGAKDNGDGVVGVAPGVPLYSVRVLDNAGYGSWSSIICGVDWVTANATALNIKVANMSLGGSGSDGPCESTSFHKAICNSVAAGVTYVVAAGNETTDFANSVPATYDEVLTVTALADFNGEPGGGAAATCRSDVDETAADFSNWAVSEADQAHTIAAPGVCINSTWKGGGYKTISGTSMASPHVAGAAALCISSGDCANPSPTDVMTKLRADAQAETDDLTNLVYYGFTGDANSTADGKYFGYLLYGGGY